MKGSILAEEIDREYRIRQMYEKKQKSAVDKKKQNDKKKTNKS